MKRLAFSPLLVAAVAGLLSFQQPLPRTIYSIHLNDIDGNALHLSSEKGKKLMFIVLSGNDADSCLDQLHSFFNRYKDSAAIFGILSYEDGYTDAYKNSIKNRVKTDRHMNIVLTEGMYSRKTSAGQSELMQWLTHIEQNLHFDGEVRGAGQKFFVDETGVLYGALGPQTPLSQPIIHKIMSKPSKPLPPGLRAN